MKNHSLIFAAIAAIAALSGCAKEKLTEQNPSSKGYHITFTAQKADTDILSRATISNGTDICWSEGDSISVFDAEGNNCKFKLTEGAGSQRGKFEGVVTKPAESYIFLYPYQASAKMESGKLTGVSLNSEQTAVSGSFDPKAGLMAARSAEDNVIEFKNIVGYVKFECGFDCKSVTFGSTDENVSLAGTATISFDESGAPSVSSVANPYSEVSLAGNIEKDKAYYIALLPDTMSKGFLLTLNSVDDKTYLRSTDKALTVKSSVVANLGTTGTENAELKAPYVTFSADAAQSFIFTRGSKITDIPASLFEYSVNGGAWTTMTAGMSIDFGGSNGDLRLRGKSQYGTAETTENKVGTGYAYIIKFGISNVYVRCTGDIRTLVDWENHRMADTKNARFGYLFAADFSSTTKPSPLVSAPELPATDLADYCYCHMFKQTSIEETPELPAKTLTSNCYNGMFGNCQNLKKIQKISATQLADKCCYQMFYNCTSIERTPALPATRLAPGCYGYMFTGCSGLIYGPEELPGEVLKDRCYESMFNNCKNLIIAPDILATDADKGERHCWGMFRYCTSLEQGPEKLASLKVYSQSYTSMFMGCTKLKTAPKLLATTLGAGCYNAMFSGCTSLATTEDNPIVLPANDLAASSGSASGCYAYMFSNAAKVKHIVLKAKTCNGAALTTNNLMNCLSSWLNGAETESGGTISAYASTTNVLTSGSTSGIPTNWRTKILIEE